jgi:hypothetical protein
MDGDQMQVSGDGDASGILRNLQRIMAISNREAISGNGPAHEIYQLARDCRDAMLFDQVSRETLRKLGASDREW